MRWITGQRAMAALLALVLIVGAGNLLATRAEVRAAQAAQRREQAVQQHQGIAVERKICTTMRELAALKPPAGNPVTNPSRAYDQRLHATLDQLGTDLGCNAPAVRR